MNRQPIEEKKRSFKEWAAKMGTDVDSAEYLKAELALQKDSNKQLEEQLDHLEKVKKTIGG